MPKRPMALTIGRSNTYPDVLIDLDVAPVLAVAHPGAIAVFIVKHRPVGRAIRRALAVDDVDRTAVV